MSIQPDLLGYVRDALKSGRSREDIRAALLAAEWTETEADAALASWSDDEAGSPVPRPARSMAAKEAFFYALLFVAFGMVAGNTLSLFFGQANFWLPERGDFYSRYAVHGLRWSMAALIVFTPAFWFLNRFDDRATGKDTARKHGTMRRWLSSIAMFVAVAALLGDALYLIYTYLNGHMTTRFLAKSGTVALLAWVVLAYFRQDRRITGINRKIPSAWVLSGLAVLSLVLSFMTIGGPAQGQKERRDQLKLSDMRNLAYDIARCSGVDRNNLPEVLDPLSCAENLDRLTAYAANVKYTRISGNEYQLCIDVEFPPAINQRFGGDIKISDQTACLRQ